MKYFISVILISVALVALFYFWRCGSPQVAAQQSEAARKQGRELLHQWRSGDTLWYEIDSVPYMPSAKWFADSMHRWQVGAPNIHDRDIYSSPLHEEYPPIKFDYKIPYWSLYRRSITFWGITFSTGQPNPYLPYSEAAQSAEVLSFPLNNPK